MGFVRLFFFLFFKIFFFGADVLRKAGPIFGGGFKIDVQPGVGIGAEDFVFPGLNVLF